MDQIPPFAFVIMTYVQDNTLWGGCQEAAAPRTHENRFPWMKFDTSGRHHRMLRDG